MRCLVSAKLITVATAVKTPTVPPKSATQKNFQNESGSNHRCSIVDGKCEYIEHIFTVIERAEIYNALCNKYLKRE